MAENDYLAVARLKVSSKDDDGPAEYIERGESVSEGDVDDFDLLVKSGSVVTEKQYAQMFPEVQLGSNQADGTPSNLPQIEGTELQLNLPDEGEEVPSTQVPAANPADPPVVEDAESPGDPDVSTESEDDNEDEDDDQTGPTLP